MKEEDAIYLEVAVWMSIVIMASEPHSMLKLHTEQSTLIQSVDSIIRRRLHVIIWCIK